MKTLWFKQCYVEPILRGEKSDTIRDSLKCKLKTGEVVSFSVGPRPPFARAEILVREDIALRDLTPERRAQVEALYSVHHDFCRLTFRLIP